MLLIMLKKTLPKLNTCSFLMFKLLYLNRVAKAQHCAGKKYGITDHDSMPGDGLKQQSKMCFIHKLQQMFWILVDLLHVQIGLFF